MTLFTIQCACSNKRAMSRLAPSGGILASIGAIEPRTRVGGQIAIALALLASCKTVDGGAVELSWKLRPASSSSPDKFVECEYTLHLRDVPDRKVRVEKMRLDWTVRTDDGHDVVGADAWPCDDSHGVTGFDLPAGTALLSVKPICGEPPNEDDALASSYIAPAEEQRRVSLGETVSLGAVQLVVSVAYCDDQSCICE
jgi:hypothetical protein